TARVEAKLAPLLAALTPKPAAASVPTPARLAPPVIPGGPPPPAAAEARRPWWRRWWLWAAGGGGAAAAAASGILLARDNRSPHVCNEPCSLGEYPIRPR